MEAKEKIELAIEEILEGTNFEVLTEIKAMLNSVYGEERNQIIRPSHDTIMRKAADIGADVGLHRRINDMKQSDIIRYLRGSVADCLSYQIIIHFPEVTIKNEKQEHLIRNIYVRLFLKPDGTLASYIQGMRTTVTEAEFISRYIHSHLPAMDPHRIVFNSFCTGVGEINQVLALLNTKYTSANFMMLLMHIKNYLEWESKDGHPYMFMENVFMRSGVMSTYNGLPDNTAQAAANIIMGRVGELNPDEIMELFNFTVTEHSIIAAPTLELERWMAIIIEGWNIRDLFRLSNSTRVFLSLRDNTGQYYALPEGAGRISHQNGTILNFKGKDIEFEIIERTQTQTNETFANPKITKETCKELSRTLTKVALTTAGIKSGSSLVYNSGTASPNKIPM